MATHPSSEIAPFAIRPPFWPFLRAVLAIFGVVVVVLFLAAAGFGAVRGKPLPSPGLPGPWWLLALLAAPLVLGVVFWLSALPWTCTLTRDGVAGRSFVGRRRYIRYDEVGSLWIYSNRGLPLLYVHSRCRQREIVLYLTGIDGPAVHAALARRAGPQHVLTREFAAR